MRRKSFLSVRKGMAVALTAAVVMSQSMMVYAEVQKSTVIATNDQTINVEDGIVVSSGSASGVHASSTEGHTTSVTVDNGISVTVNENDTTALGIDASSLGTNAKTEVTVNSGAVTVTGAGDEVNATGIRASAENGGTVEVKTGEVTSNATNDNTQGQVYGISAVGNEGGTVTVSTGAVSASGVNVTEAIYAYTSGDSSTVTVNTGTLNSSASGSTSNGIYTINDGGSMVVTTGAVTSTSTAEYAGALGAQIKATGGTTTVNTGLITAESNNQTAGVSIDSAGSSTLVNVTTGSIEVLKGETSGIRVWAHDNNGSLEMDVNGNVNSSGTGIWVRCDSQNSEAVVKVTEDVIAGDTAVDLTKTNDTSTTTIEVDGTISGGKHNVVITNGSSTSGLDVTVWKIDTSNNNATVERKAGDDYEDISEEAAEIVNYIIKVEGNLTPESRTAHENERVTLRVDVPAGYSIENFYTVNGGTNVEVLQDASGQYYLVVPRGGGVYVGVNLRSNGTSGGGSSDDNDNGRSTSSDNSVQNVTVGPKTMKVNGVDQKNDIHVGSVSADMNRALTATLSTYAATGMLDISGQYVSVPENAEIKDSFTFTADNATGLVTAYLEFKNYKEGDIILCSYFDAGGNLIVVALTPDQVNGTSVILTLPAQCTLALAGSAAAVAGPTGGPLV